MMKDKHQWQAIVEQTFAQLFYLQGNTLAASRF